MKTVSTILVATMLLLPWCLTPAHAQQTTQKGDKKVVITKRTIDPDGTETTETIVRKGQAAEDFDVEAYIRENRGENVELDVRVSDADEAEKVIVQRRKHKNVDWVEDVERHINHALAAVERNDDSAFLGVEKDSDEDPAEPGIVVEVVRGSAADKAGLRTNDVLLKLNGTPINQWKELTAVLNAAQPGDQLQVEYSRNGQVNTVNALLTKRSEVNCSPEDGVHGFLGITPAGDNDGAIAGVKIGVVSASAAEKAGLQDGDILLALNDTPIRDWEDITDFMNYTKPTETIQVSYERNGQKNTATATLGEQKAAKWNMNFEPKDFNFDIRVREKPACLGVYTSAYGEGENRGARISDFTKESAANEAEMSTGDVITAVNGIRVKGHNQLWDEIAKYQVGDQVAVEFLRENQPRQIQATLKACRDNSNVVTIFESEEAGDEQPQREFMLWNWDEQDQNQLREQRVITIHRGAEGDAEQINTAPANATIPTPDRSLKLEGFRAYPNPAQGQVTVEFQSEPLPTIVSLLDISGRQLFREELNAFDGNYFQQFDLSEYAKGTVILYIQQAGKVFTEQIIVN